MSGTRKLLRIVPEYEMNDPNGKLKSYRRRLVILLQERIWTLRLLECPPFRGLTEYQIQDVREHAPKPRVKDCPERPFLLAGLAGALMFWESAQASAAYLDLLSAHQAQVLAVLDPFASVCTELPQRGMLFDGQITRHRSILKKMQDLSDELRQSRLLYRGHAGQRLPGAPFHDVYTLSIQTVQMMAEDFLAFRPREFSRDAIHHALEAILKPFGVRNTHGNPLTAAGIKKLLRRHPPPPYMYPRDN
jgi:hypothetical protein